MGRTLTTWSWLNFITVGTKTDEGEVLLRSASILQFYVCAHKSSSGQNELILANTGDCGGVLTGRDFTLRSVQCIPALHLD